jgi:hypothetical protein
MEDWVFKGKVKSTLHHQKTLSTAIIFPNDQNLIAVTVTTSLVSNNLRQLNLAVITKSKDQTNNSLLFTRPKVIHK